MMANTRQSFSSIFLMCNVARKNISRELSRDTFYLRRERALEACEWIRAADRLIRAGPL